MKMVNFLRFLQTSKKGELRNCFCDFNKQNINLFADEDGELFKIFANK